MTERNPYLQIYDLLNAHNGPQHWWPAESDFEVMVGAVLVQNTAWVNASSAIDRLKDAGLMSASALVKAPVDDLASVIISSGYYNIKALRLKALCQWLLEQGGITKLKQQPLLPLRSALLGVHGIGPETADAILLYALNKPVFVIDAYTRRLFSRMGMLKDNARYEALRAGFESELEGSSEIFNQYHALIVLHAKTVCRKKPLCNTCCLRKNCTAEIS